MNSANVLTSQPTQLGTDISEPGCQPLNRLVRRNDKQMSLRRSSEATEVLRSDGKERGQCLRPLCRTREERHWLTCKVHPALTQQQGHGPGWAFGLKEA